MASYVTATIPQKNGVYYQNGHNSLKCILNPTESIDRRARWGLKLFERDFVVIHHDSVKHQAAKALSLLPTISEYHTVLSDDLPIHATESSNRGPCDPVKQKGSQDDCDCIPNEAIYHHADITPPSKKIIFADLAIYSYCRAATL